MVRIHSLCSIPIERGWSLPFPPPNTLHSARMCHHRPTSPPHPTPPTTPTALREALIRYNSTSTPSISTTVCALGEGSGCCLLYSTEDSVVHSLKLAAVHVPYATLHNATEGFSSVSYAQGGHKLGEGGSGQVFHCRISLVGDQGEQEIAVKVFSRAKDQKVRDHYMSSLHIKLHLLYRLTLVYTVRTKSSLWPRYRPSQCGCSQCLETVLAVLVLPCIG